MDDRVVERENPNLSAGQTATPPATEYGPDYFDTYGRLGPCVYTRENPHWLKFFGRVADEIVQRLNPRTTLDAGCAKGFLVESLRDRGVEAYGFDISEYAISEVRPDIKQYCWVASASSAIEGTYDLITCIEVCEHLPEIDANKAVRQMTSHTDTILFSSTPSDFTEATHVNVRPIIDWLRLFAEFSFVPDEAFDVGFLAPQAMLLRRAQRQPSDQALCRFASIKNQAIAEFNSREISALREELNAIRRSRAWRLLNLYRRLRSRVKRPIARVMHRIRNHEDIALSYEDWIRRCERRSSDPGRIERQISNFHYRPKISVVMPVYNTPPGLLELAIRSVRTQHYENWEICICDDASPAAEIRQCLEKWQKQDPRIKVILSERNEGISAASNRALQLATGEFVGLLDHDDELSAEALYQTVKLLQEKPQADMIYSDEDKLDSEGRRVRPLFKPDWSPEYMLACMYTCHFGVYRKRLLDEIGGFRVGFEGSQDYDLVLRLSERTNQIYHIPKILYHWRMAPGSAAASPEAKPYAYVAARRALCEHLERKTISGKIFDGSELGQYRIRFNLRGDEKVSVVVLDSGDAGRLRACIASIERLTSYSNYEVIFVDHDGLEAEIRVELSSRSHRVVPSQGPFQSARLINLGVKHAQGAYILVLHGDTEVISPDWMGAMVGFCHQEEIGVVGARLLCRNGVIQQAGLVLGSKGVTRLSLSAGTRNFSAVSAACMMVRKKVFEKAGGFDEAFSGAYSDIDFCLKVRAAGYRIVSTPWAELYHDDLHLPERRRRLREFSQLKERWEKIFRNDPYYNPNLAFGQEGFRIPEQS
jgi:GT2 family glycosyltransferase